MGVELPYIIKHNKSCRSAQFVRLRANIFFQKVAKSFGGKPREGRGVVLVFAIAGMVFVLYNERRQ